MIEQFRKQRLQLEAIEAKLSKINNQQNQNENRVIHCQSSMRSGTETICNQEKGDQLLKCDLLVAGGESPSPASSSISLTSTSNSIDNFQPQPLLTRLDSCTSTVASATGNTHLNNAQGSGIGYNQFTLSGGSLSTKTRNGNNIETVSHTLMEPLSPSIHLSLKNQIPSSNRYLENYNDHQEPQNSSNLAQYIHKSKILL